MMPGDATSVDEFLIFTYHLGPTFLQHRNSAVKNNARKMAVDIAQAHSFSKQLITSALLFPEPNAPAKSELEMVISTCSTFMPRNNSQKNYHVNDLPM